jgi:hypothetical protein
MDIGKYTIVSGESDRELIDSVMIHIRNGWQPIGGAVPATNQDGLPILIQTLIRPKMSETQDHV